METLWLLAILFLLSGPLGAVLGIIAVVRAGRLSNRLAALERGARPTGLEAAAAAAATPKSSEVFEEPAADPGAEAEPAPDAPETSAASAPAPPTSGTESAAREPFFAGFERWLARGWLVWVGAATLALGGGFLVKLALDEGWFGPAARVLAAMAAGAAMLAAGEYLRRKPMALGASGTAGRAAPAALSGAGIVTIYAAIYAAHGLYQLIPGALAFAGLALAAADAGILSIRHGPALSIFGLIGAFLAPALIGAEEPNAVALLAYVFAVAIAGFAAARLLDHRPAALIAVAGGVIWPLVWIAGAWTEPGGAALAAYLPALLAAGLLAGQDQAVAPPPVDRPLGQWGRPPMGLLTAWLAAGGAAIVLLALLQAADYGGYALAALFALSGLGLAAAWRRESYGPVAVIVGLGAVFALIAWPEAARDITGPTEQLDVFLGQAPPPPLRFVPTAMILAALFGLGGWLALQARTVKAPLAAVSAGAPVLIFATAHLRINGLETAPAWAAGAALLTLAGAVACRRIAALEGGFDRAPGAASAYALGASAAAALAVGVALEQVWLSAGFALEALAAAWLWRRFRTPALPLATLLLGLLAVARLVVFGEAFERSLGDWPIVNGLLVGYGVSAAALWGAARLLKDGGRPADGPLVQSLLGASILLGVGLVTLEIRHWINDGALTADYRGFFEIGLQTSAWLAVAAALRWRLGPSLTLAPRIAEPVLAGLAGFQAVFWLVWLANPWWGAPPVQAHAQDLGGPVLNTLLVGYAAPAGLAGAHALALGAQGRRWPARLMGGLGVLLGGVWLLLAVRQGFQGWETMASGAVGEAEGYAYSAVLLVYAAGLLAAGVIRRQANLRYVGLGLLAAVTVKVFLLDMAALEGVWRALSFLGLGAALVALSLFYQRVAPRLGGETASTRGD
ncbi:hypothetical protein DDZ18_01905 [Marinicauda salina]|uniref:DUF2339 domain-containing protein n=1 Tax=Marinicauda salina TaxID=2135793 RepID=A0A2U2BWN5_9PROT|nr:DUF2339 domain-containing protein [Marinicauda salina]PWE18384.1 hypothetical protein DDZ18_01905 [Marinicauda salina]